MWGLHEGAGDYLKYLKRGWNRKEGRGNKDFKKGGKLGQGMGVLKTVGLEPPYGLCGYSIGDGVDDTNGGSGSDFGDDKTKVGCSDNKTGDDGISNNGGGIDTNDNDWDRDNADTDRDNNVANGDKNDGDGNDANVGSNDEGAGSNDEGVDNVDDYAKDVVEIIVMIKMIDHEGVKGEFFQSNFVGISTILDANL